MSNNKCSNCSNNLSFWHFVLKGVDKIIEQKPYECPKCNNILFQDTGMLLVISIVLTALPFVVTSLVDGFFEKFNILEYLGLLLGYIFIMFYALWKYVLHHIK